MNFLLLILLFYRVGHNYYANFFVAAKWLILGRLLEDYEREGLDFPFSWVFREILGG